MKKYKLRKHDNYYVLYRYLYLDKSVGFYMVTRGTRKEIFDYLKIKNIKLGVSYE